MDSRDYQMTMGASINNAVKLVANGIVELETDDIGAEIAELAQLLFDAVLPQMEKAAGKSDGGSSRPSGRKSSGGSKTRGSSGGKSRGKSGGKMEGDITPAQLRKLRELLDERDHDLDIDWDSAADLSKQKASDAIGELLECDFLD